MFLHWELPPDFLFTSVPDQLKLDLFNGRAYISLVAFRMQNIRPRYLPAVDFLSDFAEINLRTYIDIDGRKGVYFLNIEAAKGLSVFVARMLSGLPYKRSQILCEPGRYESSNRDKGNRLDTVFTPLGDLTIKTELDRWLTERYCLYLTEGNRGFRYDIHHLEWPLQAVKLNKLELSYAVGGYELSSTPQLAHFSSGVKVLAWKRTRLFPL